MFHAAPLLCCAVSLAPLALPSTGQTWTVDASGAGDFTTVQAAIDAVLPGDVLLVMPGTYPSFVLGKSLTILGPAAGPAPWVTGLSAVAGAPSFTLAGLTFDGLAVSDVAGRGAIDACTVVPAFQDAVAVVRADELLIERTTIQGDVVYYSVGMGEALYAEDSNIVLVECDLVGGYGLSESGGFGADYAPGAAGLRALRSTIQLVRTDAVGGHGGALFSLFTFGEEGGDAVEAVESTIFVRGAGNVFTGGEGAITAPDGVSIRANASTVVHSGVAMPDGIVTSGGAVVHNPSDEPFLAVVGSDVPGQVRRLRLWGPEGQLAVLVGSLKPAFLSLPAFELPLFLDLTQPFLVQSVVTAGFADPITMHLLVPATLTGLEGLTLHFQAGFPGLAGTLAPGAMQVTNPASAVLRF